MALEKQSKILNREYIRILEIIFGIIVAVGITAIIPKTVLAFKEYFLTLFPLALVVIAVLARFFFVPSLNIKIQLDKIYDLSKFQQSSIIFIDVPLALSQAILFSFLCYAIGYANAISHNSSVSFSAFESFSKLLMPIL